MEIVHPLFFGTNIMNVRKTDPYAVERPMGTDEESLTLPAKSQDKESTSDGDEDSGLNDLQDDVNSTTSSNHGSTNGSTSGTSVNDAMEAKHQRTLTNARRVLLLVLFLANAGVLAWVVYWATNSAQEDDFNTQVSVLSIESISLF